MTKNRLKSEFQRARKAAGIPTTFEDYERGYRWHDNRHTGATRFLRKTGNLKLTQHLLGHRRIETTAKYAHAGIEDLRAALNGESQTDYRTVESATSKSLNKKEKPE
jgi:site-specific recombinase XerD